MSEADISPGMASNHRITLAAIILAVALLFGVRACYRASHSSHYRSSVAAGEMLNGPCLDFRQAQSHAGENACVTGFVLRAFTSKTGNTFLDFCRNYHDCPFSSVIFARDRSKFGNLETLAGRQVQIRGPITTYQGKAEIIIHDAWQIRTEP